MILNDNGMSISENVGALSKLFQRVRVDPTLTRVREELERGLARLPGASEIGGHIRDATKSLWFVPGALFEALGFAYMGPIDGHDIEGVRRALRTTLEMNRPVVLHVKTVKGRGYAPAEADGEAMHGATPFVIESGKAAGKKAPGPPNYTEVFGHALVAEAERDPRVVGITAAMLKGTGMQHMMARFPERTYDVGIAEQHAVVFACGLAIAGYRPVCAIYSTFLQRAFDPIVHDVAIQELPVVFAIDRGGLVGDDGPTHHGVFDLAYLRAIPGMTVMAPMDEAELVAMLHTALRMDGPVALRYPRGAGLGVPVPERPEPVEIGRGVVLEAGERVALIGYGHGGVTGRGGRRPGRRRYRHASDGRQRPLLQADRRRPHPPARRAPRAARDDRGPRDPRGLRQRRAGGARGHPRPGAAPRHPRPLHRPRQARAAARGRRPHRSADRGAHHPRRRVAHADAGRRGLIRRRADAARAAPPLGRGVGTVRGRGYHPARMPRSRLDVALVERGLFPNRSRAQAAVMAGRVRVDGRPVDKPGTGVAPGASLEVAEGTEFVSRGGVKLASALDALRVDVAGSRALDLGASTGGFTDCLLRRGAERVIALDVGYGQLAWALRQDPRVHVMERTNARYLSAGRPARTRRTW